PEPTAHRDMIWHSGSGGTWLTQPWPRPASPATTRLPDERYRTDPGAERRFDALICRQDRRRFLTSRSQISRSLAMNFSLAGASGIMLLIPVIIWLIWLYIVVRFLRAFERG